MSNNGGLKVFKLSRYWNRLMFFLIEVFIKLIWDITGQNADILDPDSFSISSTKTIMCNYK